MPFDSRRARQSNRARRRPDLTAPERLEPRELLAFSPTGASLPDLTVSGIAAPVAAWGGPLGLTIDVRNLGASSMIEPLNLTQGASSNADSQPTTVQVLISSKRQANPNMILVGTFSVPALQQNSDLRLNELLTLPKRPRGFPGDGGKIFITLIVNGAQQSPDNDPANNVAAISQPVQIEAPLPDLVAIALDTPPVMQPGDTIQANIKVANFGTVDTAPQGPVTVDLVASTDTNFGPGDIVLAHFTVDNIAPLADVPATNPTLGDVNINDPVNISTLTTQNITLPKAPATYFIGVIVDPANTIREIHEITRGPSFGLSPVLKVGPPISGLPPAGVVTTPAPISNIFPIPAFGPINIFSTATTTTTVVVPAGTSSSGNLSFLGFFEHRRPTRQFPGPSPRPRPTNGVVLRPPKVVVEPPGAVIQGGEPKPINLGPGLIP